MNKEEEKTHMRKEENVMAKKEIWDAVKTLLSEIKTDLDSPFSGNEVKFGAFVSLMSIKSWKKSKGSTCVATRYAFNKGLIELDNPKNSINQSTGIRLTDKGWDFIGPFWRRYPELLLAGSLGIIGTVIGAILGAIISYFALRQH